MYTYSLERYGKSPYIYPLWGLGGLPEGFSRLSAINNGTFMLNRSVDEIKFNPDGTGIIYYQLLSTVYYYYSAWGIRAGNEIAKATMVIGDPSYFPVYFNYNNNL